MAAPARGATRENFGHLAPRKRKIPLQNRHLTPNLKLRMKATFDFWTFEPPLRRPGLRGNTHTQGSCTRTQKASCVSQRTSIRTAGARMAGSSSGGVGSADAYCDARQCLPIMK